MPGIVGKPRLSLRQAALSSRFASAALRARDKAPITRVR